MIHEIETEDFDKEWDKELILDGLSSDKDHVVAQIHCESQGQHKRRKVKQDLFASELLVNYHNNSE